MKNRGTIRAFVAVFGTAVALIAAEAATRVIDGYWLLPLRLDDSPRRRADTAPPSPPSQKWNHETDAWPYVQQLPVADGVERAWFRDALPSQPPWQPDPDLVDRAKRYQTAGELPPSYEWNWNYVLGAVCRHEPKESDELFARLDDVFVFDPGDGSDTPSFRFLRHATYTSGLVTNRFGWRGPDVPLRKPPRTIRLAFVGASTTVGMHAEPYSYPELVGIWLNRWAREHHLDVSFEAINAGREGINSRSIQAVVRQELVPLEPDLVVYYEGANQFWPADYIWTPLPERSLTSVPKPGFAWRYSAIARRVEGMVRHAVVPGQEPQKPPLVVHWPPDLDERDPDVAYPRLPIELPHILGDLDRIRLALDGEGSHLVMTSFVWLVYAGMVLDPVRDAFMFDYLNTKYWPFSYRHMRRLLDFQTRVFRNYARAHDLDFIDVASGYPHDPRLFSDAIHMTRAGIRMQAWIVFNGLVPVVERRLAAVEWPRPARAAWTRHPAFRERRLVPMAEVRTACGRSNGATQ